MTMDILGFVRLFWLSFGIALQIKLIAINQALTEQGN